MAQLVERRVRNAKARGSNPLISTKAGNALLVATERKYARYFLFHCFSFARALVCSDNVKSKYVALHFVSLTRLRRDESPYLHQIKIIRTQQG